MGIGGVIVVALITWMMGGNPLDALQMVTQSQMANVTTQTSNGQEFTEEEEELAKFSRQILPELRMYGKKSLRRWGVNMSRHAWCSIPEAYKQVAAADKLLWDRSTVLPTSAYTLT